MSELPEVPMGPELLHQMSMSFVPSRVLGVAAQFGFFSLVARGEETAADVARAAGTSERGTRMILDALVPLQLLTKSGDGRYQLTPPAEQYLVRDSSDYLGTLFETDHLWNAWTQLPEIVRTGTALRQVETQQVAEEFFPILIRMLHIVNREPARRAAEILSGGLTGEAPRVLDIACGSAVWSLALAQANPAVRVTAQDFPAVLRETAEYVKREGMTEQFEYLAGDLKDVDLGTDRFDLAILGNIVHSEGEDASRDLFRRLHRTLTSRGRIVIVDMIPNDERTGPAFPVFFALNMLVNTEKGDTYTLAEYTDWLRDAGFDRIETADIGSHSPLIIAINSD